MRVWPNSELTLLEGAVDCRPFQPAVDIATLQGLLGVSEIWNDGFRGQGVIVGIIDEGVDGSVYPVAGGFSRPDGQTPGSAPVSSHGSMCAADILVAAPDGRLYDYPFLGVPLSGGALQMFQAVLNQRSIDGTPHLTNNSYGFVGVPDGRCSPTHEVHDPNHPVHRKVREVVAAGVPCFFAAGNCGAIARATSASRQASVRASRSTPPTASSRSSPSPPSTAGTIASATPRKGRAGSRRKSPTSPATATSSATSARGGRLAAPRRTSTTAPRRRRRWPPGSALS